MKKGFTLVELLAIIILLALIFSISYPKLVEMLEKNSGKIDEYTLRLIYNAADDYGIQKGLTQVGNSYCVQIGELKNRNLIPVDIDEYSGKYVEVLIGKNKNSTKVVDSCIDTYDASIEILLKETTGGGITTGFYRSVLMQVNFKESKDSNYIKSSITAIVPTGTITDDCGSQIDPGECISTNVTTLEPNNWYKVSGDAEVMYTQSSLEKQTLYGAIFDGRRYHQISTGIIPSIFYYAKDFSYSNSINPDVQTMKDALVDLRSRVNR